MTQNSTLVSAIVPTYNRAGIVGDAIDSILGQTYPHVEVIVVDDGSTDGTQSVLNRYGDRIRVITQENAGAAAARNRGVEAARGDLLAFLDSDDLWLPRKLERQVTLLEKAGPSAVCCLCNIRMRWHDKDRSSFEIAQLNPPCEEGIWLNADEVLATRFVLFNQGVVIRREVMERLGGFDESLRFMEDFDLPLRLSLEGRWTFIREPLTVWRETKDSLYGMSKVEELCQRECTVQAFEKHLAALVRNDGRRALQKRVRRQVRKSRRQLTATRVGGMSFRGAGTLGRVLAKIEQFRSGVSRRSPWFPQMKVVAVD